MIELPTVFSGVSITPTLITARNDLVPSFGGPEQRRNRMGSRYQLKVQLEPMPIEDANEWADLDDEAETCLFVIPQPCIDTGTPGAPRVNGAGQSGSSLVVNGVTPHYALGKNWWISLVSGGQHFCYRVRSEAIADASGNLTIPLRTMLRKPPADNDVVEIAEPRIEGFVTVDEGAWMIDGNHLISLGFTIKERE
jgi:hypothetical protein